MPGRPFFFPPRGLSRGDGRGVVTGGVLLTRRVPDWVIMDGALAKAAADADGASLVCPGFRQLVEG
jgi:hypothetical protein